MGQGCDPGHLVIWFRCHAAGLQLAPVYELGSTTWVPFIGRCDHPYRKRLKIHVQRGEEGIWPGGELAGLGYS